MKASLLCFGAEGARIAESLLVCAVSGALPHEDVIRVTLLYPSREDLRRLSSLYTDYAGLRGAWGLEDHTGFRPILSLRSITDDSSLSALVRDENDSFLLRTFYTAESTAGPAMTDSFRTAETAFRLSLKSPEGTLSDLLQDASGMATLVVGSLAESCCGGCARHLLKEIMARAGLQPVGAILLAGFRTEDRDGDIRAVLSRLPETPFLTILGLPADCRATGDMPHLLHLLALRAVKAFLSGCTGEYTVAMPTDSLGWDCFSPDGDQWGAALSSLLQADALLEGVYGPEANRSLGSPNLIRDRLNPWFNQFFIRRRLNPLQRQQAMKQLEAARRLFHASACFLRDVQTSLPYIFCSIPELEAAGKAASAHYDALLNLAGQYALVAHDNEQTSLHETSFVHRNNMEETAVDQALQEQTLLEEDLIKVQEEQTELNRALGTRAVRMMLEGFADKTREEYSSLNNQAAEAHRRIEAAAGVARPGEMARIDQARARLRRMERRVASLEGKAHQAQVDLELARLAPLTPPPALEQLAPLPCSVFWPERWLALLCYLGEEHTKARQRMIQDMFAAWPDRAPSPRALQDRILQDGGTDSSDAALVFLDAILRAARA